MKSTAVPKDSSLLSNSSSTAGRGVTTKPTRGRPRTRAYGSPKLTSGLTPSLQTLDLSSLIQRTPASFPYFNSSVEKATLADFSLGNKPSGFMEGSWTPFLSSDSVHDEHLHTIDANSSRLSGISVSSSPGIGISPSSKFD